MRARLTFTRMVHYKWITQANRAARSEGFTALITGRRDERGYAAMDFFTVVADSSAADIGALEQTLDRTLTMSAPGYWNSAESAVKAEPDEMPEQTASIVQWVRDSAQSPPVWIGRDRGELVGLIT